ncbi:MAG: carboxypeptidase regulatory-like domain-containing protein [Desulfobacterales bacterium]|nr:carboxypeptidase regulatory-like domain-containing protein [Desulfobacterales bacterium]
MKKIILLLSLIFIFGTSVAYAHKVNVFAYVQSGMIYTESYFPDGSPVSDGTIEIYDSSKNMLITGKTDKEGLFSCKIIKQDDLTIVINASMGHKSSFKLKKSDLGE